MFIKQTEKGQALILIALAAIGLFAFAALAIDGSRVYSEKRHAQNAADSAALAGALAYTRHLDDDDIDDCSFDDDEGDYAIKCKAQDRAASNGYDNNGDTNVVTISAADIPSGPSSPCEGEVAGKDITVTIEAYIDTTFARVIGRNQVITAVTATSRACDFALVPPFNGAPIVGLNDDDNADPKACAFTTGTSGSSFWKVKGGDIQGNGCAYSKDPGSVEFVDAGACAATSDGAEDVKGTWDPCTPHKAPKIKYPEDVDAIMPPYPCGPGGVGITQEAHGSSPNFSDGVYCINDLDALDKKDITLDNATLYVTDPAFNLKFAGGGGFYGTATQEEGYTGSRPYEGYYMVVARIDPPCPDFAHGDQVIEWRGNGTGTFSGTVLAPSACLDVRGNGSPAGMKTQLIAYIVGSNGDASVYINYDPDDNRKEPVLPKISVLK